MSTAELVIAGARALVDAPYRHRGRGPIGYDCLGVVLKAAWGAGLVPESFDFTNYTQNVAYYELERHLNECPYVERLTTWRDAQPADILLQRFHIALPASHLILITKRESDSLWGVHAALRLGGVVEQRVAHLERNHAAYRLKEVVHG